MKRWLITKFLKCAFWIPAYCGVDCETSNWNEPRQITVVITKKFRGITYVLEVKQSSINEAYYKDFLKYMERTNYAKPT